jgi:hypothetical protein
MWKLSTVVMAAPKLILFGAALMAPLIWKETWKLKVTADFWVAVSVYAGAGAGLGFLWCFKPRPVFGWAPLVITAGAIRMAVSVIAAFVLWSAFRPEKTFFWSVFLVASMAVLLAETLVVRSSLTRASMGPGLAGGITTESKAA